MLVRRWATGFGWRSQSIQIHHDGGQWFVRYVGRVITPDVAYDSEQEALDAVLPRVEGWEEIPADRSPRAPYR